MPDNKSLTLLVVILHDVDRLPDLLQSWRRVGVPGATILPSAGSHDAENMAQRGGLNIFMRLFDQEKSPQRTVLSLIDDPEILEVAIAEADRVVKGFDSPRSGILFTVPIDHVLGLQKWIQSEKPVVSAVDSQPGERGAERLLQWFEADVKERYGEEALLDWTRQRETPISEIVPLIDLKPTIVKVNTPLTEVMCQLLANPGMPAACVVNNEDRLMGVIPIKALADVLMIPVMPESYITNPDEYEKALQYADINQTHFAANVMREAIYVYDDETLEKAYQRMKENNLSGLPVVGRNYHVKGFITLLGFLALCFPKNFPPENQF